MARRILVTGATGHLGHTLPSAQQMRAGPLSAPTYALPVRLLTSSWTSETLRRFVRWCDESGPMW